MNIIKRKLNILKKRKIDKKIDNLFSWIKGAELVELKSCNITMARNFHLNNGAIELRVNEETQNFEYKI